MCSGISSTAPSRSRSGQRWPALTSWRRSREGTAAVIEQGPVGLAGLFGEAGASDAAGGVDQEGGHEGGVDVVPHGVGDRHVQGVLVEAVVVGVTGDVGSRDQGAREGEFGGLAGGGRGQELALYLRRQGDRGGSAAPVVEIGEAAVGDDDVGQRVRRLFDLLQHVLGDVDEIELQDPDGVAAVGDRGKHPLLLCAIRYQHRFPGAQGPVADTADQGHLVVAVLLWCRLLLVDPQQSPADDVHEQARHVTLRTARADCALRHRGSAPARQPPRPVRSGHASQEPP